MHKLMCTDPVRKLFLVTDTGWPSCACKMAHGDRHSNSLHGSESHESTGPGWCPRCCSGGGRLTSSQPRKGPIGSLQCTSSFRSVSLPLSVIHSLGGPSPFSGRVCAPRKALALLPQVFGLGQQIVLTEVELWNFKDGHYVQGTCCSLLCI